MTLGKAVGVTIGALFGGGLTCFLLLRPAADDWTPPAPRPAPPVKLVAIAPDGTKLWATTYNGRDVFFSAAGASTTRTMGAGIDVAEVPAAR